MENRFATQADATAPSPRYDAILSRLKVLAAELTGIEERFVDTEVHFFQAGIDSLLLLQAIQAIEKRIGVRVSLVEMLEEITTLDALARHIDGILPPEAVLNGKPASAADAVERWRAMRGRSGVLHTGHCLREAASGRHTASHAWTEPQSWATTCTGRSGLTASTTARRSAASRSSVNSSSGPAITD